MMSRPVTVPDVDLSLLIMAMKLSGCPPNSGHLIIRLTTWPTQPISFWQRIKSTNMSTTLTTIIQHFRNKKVLVIGDIILDVYYKGMSTRLSPEAPVPVVDILEKIQVPGGAANTAVNLKSLGADVTVLSVTGNDTEGQETTALLRERGIHTWGILRSPDRHTLVKSRIVSGAQILTRFDSGSDSDISACIEERLINYLKSAFQYCDAVLISDYCKGVITANILNAMKVLTRKTGKFLGVDSRR